VTPTRSIPPPGATGSVCWPIWADQTARLQRTEAALDLAAHRTWTLDRADAAEWLERRLATLPNGEATIVFHTIVWQYLALETRERAEALIRAAGERATSAAPLFWLRMEADADPDGAGLRLASWPGGGERLLGRADFHGRWARWL
jgi:hypothetical protein